MIQLLLLWNRRQWRRRQEILADAQHRQDAQHRAALARLHGLARTARRPRAEDEG
jgi:hypothetical protein